MATGELVRHGDYLTVLALDGAEIYGELADAEWREETTEAGRNILLSGIAGEGTLDRFIQLNDAGVVDVSFVFQGKDGQYRGTAKMLRPEVLSDTPASAEITIETMAEPVSA